MDVNDRVNRIKALETLFSDNVYNGSGSKAFAIEEGTVPVMISAPHAVNHFRNGQEKQADVYTGGIARYLHETAGCHVMYSCLYTGTDPNFDPPGMNAYQDALIRYLSGHPVLILLDLHGAARWREYALEMGTAPDNHPQPGQICEPDPSLHEHKYIAGMIRDIFAEHFRRCPEGPQEIWKNVIFDAGDQNTITKYISGHTETACVQMEINRYYRDPGNPDGIRALTDGFSELIRALAGTERLKEDR